MGHVVEVTAQPAPGAGRAWLPALDLRSVGLFRVALGALMVLDFLEFRLFQRHPFYARGGLVDPAMHAALSRLHSDWVNGPGPGLLPPTAGTAYTVGFFCVGLALAVAFTLGVRTRPVGMALVAVFWSIHHRNPVAVEGDDRLLLCFLVLGLMLPLDGTLALRSRARAVVPARVTGWAAAACVLQVVAIYVPNVLFKTGPHWADGTAIAYALMDPLWARPGPSAWLLRLPGVCAALTHAVRPVEAMIPLALVWPSARGWTRSVGAAGMVALHGGIAVFFSFGHLPHILMVAAVLMLPPAFWDLLASRGLGPPLTHSAVQAAPSRRASVPGMVAVAVLVVFNGFNPEPVRDSPRWPTAVRSALMRLRRSPLTMQCWALYCPDPIDEVGVLKVRGVLSTGRQVDLHAGGDFSPDDRGIAAYQQDPWQNLALYYLYGEDDAVPLLRRWARDELTRGRPDGALRRVDVVYLHRVLTGPGQGGPWVAEVVATAGTTMACCSSGSCLRLRAPTRAAARPAPAEQGQDSQRTTVYGSPTRRDRQRQCAGTQSGRPWAT